MRHQRVPVKLFILSATVFVLLSLAWSWTTWHALAQSYAAYRYLPGPQERVRAGAAVMDRYRLAIDRLNAAAIVSGVVALVLACVAEMSEPPATVHGDGPRAGGTALPSAAEPRCLGLTFRRDELRTGSWFLLLCGGAVAGPMLPLSYMTLWIDSTAFARMGCAVALLFPVFALLSRRRYAGVGRPMATVYPVLLAIIVADQTVFPVVWWDHRWWVAMSALAALAAVYAMGYVCALRLFRGRAYVMAVAVVAFLSGAVVDLAKANRTRGCISGILQYIGCSTTTW